MVFLFLRNPLFRNVRADAWRSILMLSFSRLLLHTAFESRAIAEDNSLLLSFLFDLSYGMTTTKSKMVASNDMGSALAYSLGGFAGSSRNLEFNLGFESKQTAFLLNDSKVTHDWQDTKLRYHLGFFYTGVVFSRLN